MFQKEAKLEIFVCFVALRPKSINSYGHCGTVSSPNHTFSWGGLNKRLTSNLCTGRALWIRSILQNIALAWRHVVVVVVINSPNIGTPRIEWNKVKC